MLDSSAVLCMLHQEPGCEEVRRLFRGRRYEMWMTLVNLGEVIYIVERERGDVAADQVLGDLQTAVRSDGTRAIQWLDTTFGLVRLAAGFKARGGMSYADCFVAAAAQQLAATVLTKDSEFKVAETAGLPIRWLLPAK